MANFSFIHYNNFTILFLSESLFIMKIAVICDVLGEPNNGTTLAALNLINSLKKKGHEVRVVCDDPKRKGLDGFYIVGKYNFGPFNGYVEKNGVSLSKPDLKTMREAVIGCDVIHCMMPFALSKAAVKIATENGVPITAGFHCQAENVTSHFFLMNANKINTVAYKAFYNSLYKYCTAIHYPSEFICDIFEKIVGPTNHYIISNGVSNEFTKKQVTRPKELQNKFVIVFTGRYSKEKSHALLIDAVYRSKYKDTIKLIFAGCGPMKEKIEKESEKLPIKPTLAFFTRSELIDVLNIADLYVHPAEVEIEAIACLEAIACGSVPVINNSPKCATKAFAIDEMNLFNYNDSKDLANKIDYWIEHPEEKRKRSNDYLNYAKQFDFETCMEKMEAMLKDAAKKR